MEMLIQRGPAGTFCQAFRWPKRPFSFRPTFPTIQELRASPFSKTTPNLDPGFFELKLSDLSSGSLHDIYCYSEEYIPGEPTVAAAAPDTAPRKGMTLEAIGKTRLTIKTQGPQYYDPGWTCLAGHQCGINGIIGTNLSSLDKVIVQNDQCPGLCQCS